MFHCVSYLVASYNKMFIERINPCERLFYTDIIFFSYIHNDVRHFFFPK